MWEPIHQCQAGTTIPKRLEQDSVHSAVETFPLGLVHMTLTWNSCSKVCPPLHPVTSNPWCFYRKTPSVHTLMMVKLRWGYLKVQYVTSFGTCWGYLVSMLPLLDSSETQFVEMSKMLFIHVLSMFFFFFIVMQRNTYACHLSSNIYWTEVTVLTFSVHLFIVLQRLRATLLEV